jgi:FkbM family methyltransferase
MINETIGNKPFGRMAVRDRFTDIKVSIKTESPVIVDGGANIGNVIDLFLAQYISPKIYAFEPNPALVDILKKKYVNNRDIKIYPYAVGSEPKNVLFNIINKGDSSSVLNPSNIFKFYHGDNTDIEKTLEVPMVRLDDELFEMKTIDILKLDLQGYELEALKGCEKILQHIKIITTEIEFVSLYDEQPLFADIDTFLRNHGFRLLNLYELWTHPDGQLTAGDAVYLNLRFFSFEKKLLTENKQSAIYNALACKGWTDENKLSKLFDLVQETAHLDRDILEIGSAWGRSTILLGLSSSKKIWSIDPHSGGRAYIQKGEDQNSFDEFLKNITLHGIADKVNVLKNTTQEVLNLNLIPSSINFSLVFIDGLHTPEGVQKDFELAYDRLVPSGVMVFDDYFEPTVKDYAEMIDTMAYKNKKQLVKDEQSKLVFFYK